MNGTSVLEEDKEDNVITNEEFVRRKSRKGMGFDGGSTVNDWLSPMKLGSEFLVRPSKNANPNQPLTWILAKFMQAGCKDGNVLVIPMKGEEVTAPEAEWIWVDPIEFCKFWEFRGYVLVPVEE